MSTTPTEILETVTAALETTVATSPVDPTAATEAGLNIESIKSLMDSFDPASLLPDLSEVFGSLATVCRVAVMIGPIVLLVLGLAYLFLSPKEANYYFGYRCYYGMGSVHAWRFTQRMAGILLGGLGLILTIVMYVISGGFAGMEMTQMVWKAAGCLAWQVGLALVLTLLINFLAFFFFDAKGNPRRKKKKEK